MATKTWNGSNGNFTDSGSWSPAGVPSSGDIAVINSGTVLLATNPIGVALQLNEALGSTAATTLTLNGASLPASSTLTVNNLNSYNNTAPSIVVSGAASFAGTESFYGSRVNFTINAGSSLTNSGVMNFYDGASAVTSGAGTLVNNNTIAFTNPASTTQVPILGTSVAGTGTIALGAHARVSVSAPVSAGQTVILNDGASGNEILQINQPSTFAATISGFSQSDLIAVINTPYTGATYTSTGANSGTLNLYSGAALQGSLNFTGQYTLSSFSFTFNDFGGGQSNLQISTSVVNSVSGGLPPGYQNGGFGTGGTGGAGGSTLPMYRFFDTRFGTHLFTADSGEVSTIKATRGDLTQERNGFGSVAQSDPNAQSVYRFFNLNDGTHFYTASQAEFAGLTTKGTATYRADLTYEPSSTLYEHATQQAGDIAVYRLFDTVHGTQFLTGDQGEYNNITTAGLSTFRGDLRPEGVAFYAPTGSFFS